jgi:phenylalanyl-tRNA synthetase alpha chain
MYLTADQLDRALNLRDLSDPADGPHAMQLLLDDVLTAVRGAWPLPLLSHRGPRVVPVADNYDRLRYPPEAITRDSRYSRYVDDHRMLRAHTTAHVPALLPELTEPDVVLACPGVCYRRDAIDRLHVGEPHQLDVWRVRRAEPPLGEDDLTAMVGLVVGAALPGRRWRTVPGPHPYTHAGRQIDVLEAGTWVEVGECGLAHRELLAAAGLPECASGLAMGVGLDRLLMLRKGLDDIRLLRSTDPRIAGQMLDLRPYHPVSAMPAARRDLSIAIRGDVDVELLGDRVREALGADAAAVESVELLSSTPYAELPEAARRRIGIREGQRNVLVRVVLRPLERTLTGAQANRLRDRIYAALHEGSAHEWAEREGAAAPDGGLA